LEGVLEAKMLYRFLGGGVSRGAVSVSELGLAVVPEERGKLWALVVAMSDSTLIFGPSATVVGVAAVGAASSGLGTPTSSGKSFGSASVALEVDSTIIFGPSAPVIGMVSVAMLLPQVGVTSALAAGPRPVPTALAAARVLPREAAVGGSWGWAGSAAVPWSAGTSTSVSTVALAALPVGSSVVSATFKPALNRELERRVRAEDAMVADKRELGALREGRVVMVEVGKGE